MRGLLAVTGQRGLSAGTLLIAAGGLALYQMTSLVLGSAGSRELHLSLAMPTVDADELPDAVRPGVNQLLGAAVAVTPEPYRTGPVQALSRPVKPLTNVSLAAAPIGALKLALPVPSEASATYGNGHRQPRKRDNGD